MITMSWLGVGLVAAASAYLIVAFWFGALLSWTVCADEMPGPLAWVQAVAPWLIVLVGGLAWPAALIVFVVGAIVSNAVEGHRRYRAEAAMARALRRPAQPDPLAAVDDEHRITLVTEIHATDAWIRAHHATWRPADLMEVHPDRLRIVISQPERPDVTARVGDTLAWNGHAIEIKEQK